MPAVIVIITDHHPTGEEYVRRRIAEMCDEHLTRILDVASLSCLIEPEDQTNWIVARAAQDEYDKRGLIDGQRP